MNVQDHPGYKQALGFSEPLSVFEGYLFCRMSEDTFTFCLCDSDATDCYVGGTNPSEPGREISPRLREALDTGRVTAEIVAAFQALAKLHS